MKNQAAKIEEEQLIEMLTKDPALLTKEELEKRINIKIILIRAKLEHLVTTGSDKVADAMQMATAIMDLGQDAELMPSSHPIHSLIASMSETILKLLTLIEASRIREDMA